MIGILFVLIGFLIRLISVRHMGNFRLTIDYSENITTKGIYSIVRHPSYVGSFLVFIGLSMLNIKFAFLVLVFVFFLTRALEEEKILSANKYYSDYCKKVGMFIPNFRGN